MTPADDARADTFERLIECFLAERPANVEEFLRRHPEHAGELREVLPVMEALGDVRRSFDEGSVEERQVTLERWTALREQLAAGVSAQVGPEPSGSRAHDSERLSRVLGRIQSLGYRTGRFEPGMELARGGQGAVLVVWDGTLQRHLAMKVALAPTEAAPHPSPSAHSLGRFLEEARVTAQLDHPGIVPVHDLGLDPERRVYFTMKLVKGRDLRTVFELVERGEEGWTRTRALHVVLKVCEAMAYAHSKGVIHRDLKPSNVMVGKFGEVYVMDWGLARVLGGEDKKDIRIRPALTSELSSPRHELSGDLDSPLVTMDGDVVGTPAYMPPEQARGEIAAMGPHSDVYAVGAMVYQLLTGRMPYVPPGARLGNRAVWELVQRGPPVPVHAVAADVPAELEAICDKAMARDVTARYADMSVLAEDLRAYLEHRVVQAYRTGAIAELRKWVQRNQALATSLAAGALAIVIGLVSSLVLKAQSDANAERAANERADVLRLSALQRVEDLTDEAEALWPAWPDRLEAYDGWLGRARALLLELEPDPGSGSIGHRARLAELEARALPYTSEQRVEDLRSHARAVELANLQKKLAAARRAQAVRAGRTQVEEPALDPSSVPAQAGLYIEVMAMVSPDRTRFGDEAQGLALARHAVAGRAASGYDHANNLDALAWALQACGLDEDALAVSEEALGAAPAVFEDVFTWYRDLQRTHIERAASGALIAELEQELATLEAEVSRGRTWRFTNDADRWWHAQLTSLVEQLEALADPSAGLIDGQSPELGWGINRRRAWALGVEELTRSGADVARRWAEALASIADRSQCPAYGGLSIEPQLDLVPIGRDRHSGLWEFGHPLTGEVPRHDGDGKLSLTEESGLVLVLIPGGTFYMGSQRVDPSALNYDPGAQSDSPVRQLAVEPFFLSKYELNQGQWQRLTGSNPSAYYPGAIQLVPFTLLHPVEQVSWTQCMRVCRRMGMSLPNEAEWEYAARAGTSTVWWSGDSRTSLVGTINLADRSAARFPEINWAELEDWPELDDGYMAHAPVDHYLPNPFGLHDMGGNVQEWCRNAFDAWSLDLTREPSEKQNPAVRGGSYQSTASQARSAHRGYSAPESAAHTIGLRPARKIDGEVRHAGDRRGKR